LLQVVVVVVNGQEAAVAVQVDFAQQLVLRLLRGLQLQSL
jgi:hypothetical protein